MSTWSRVGEALSRRTGRTLLVVAVVTALLGFGLTRLEFATGQDSYIDPDSQVADDNARYQSLFGGENMVVLFTMPPGRTVVDLFTPENIDKLDAIEAEIAADPAIESVISPVALLTWTQDMVATGVATDILARTSAREPDAAAVARRQEDLTITALRLTAAGEQDLANPDWRAFLIFGNDGFALDAEGALVAPPADDLVVRRPLQAFIRDSHHAVFAAVLVGNAALDELSNGSGAVETAFSRHAFEDVAITITGTPTFLTDINDYLQGGMMTLGAVAVVVMAVILLVGFAVRWRLLPMLGMAVGVLWGFAVFGYTGTSLSLVTIAGLPILIGLGIEFAIQIQNRIEEERTLDRTPGPYGETLRRMGPPMLGATATAVIAFLTVRISRVPMVQDFGLLLSVGIIALLAAGIVLPTTIIGARERRWPTRKPPRVGWVERTVRWLGSLPRATVVPLVVLAVVLPVAGLLLESGTRIESDPINWADPSSQTIVDARHLEDETGLATTLGVFVETDGPSTGNGVFTDQMGAFVVDLVDRTGEENAEVVGASSLATTVGWLTDVDGAPSIPPSGLDMLQAYEVAPPALQRTLVAADGNAAQVLFQLGPSGLEERSVVLDRIGEAIADPGDAALLPANATATTGGLAVVGVGLLENITANRSALTIVALLLVGAFVVLAHRDVARGLLTMVPVLLAVGTSALLIRLLDVTLSPLTTVGGPLVVATCAEFSILLVARYAEERERGLDPHESTRVAAERTGRAFFTSALTTLGGFAVLMLSPLPLLADFGLVVTINIGVAVLSALVVIPPLVMEADRRGLLTIGGHEAERRTPARWRAPVGWASGLALAIAGAALVVATTGGGDETAAAPRRTESAEVPAQDQTSATSSPADVVAASVPNDGDILAPGPAERPSGLVAGLFWDALTGAGVEPGTARCAADDLIATTAEADLLAMGIAADPRPAAVDELLAAAATRCGVTSEQLAAAAES